MTESMFHNDHGVENQCYQCRWERTAMCPYSDQYRGRVMFDTSLRRNNACHRFVMTEAERERRWQQVMNKMSENLPEGDYPF